MATKPELNIIDFALTGPITVDELRSQLDILSGLGQGDAVIAVGSCCGVHFYSGKPEVELARFKPEDQKYRTVQVDYFPEAEQDPDDDQLAGPRQTVVILR